MRRKSEILADNIYGEIKKNPKITELELANKYDYSERTIRRYVNYLKESGKIRLISFGRKKIWQILE